MKQKLRQISKISLLLIFFAIVSCNDDEQVNYQTQNQEHLVVKEISFEELLKQNVFFEAYGKVTKKMQKKGSVIDAKTALEDEYDFTIGDAPAKVIETHDLMSYTMLIIRDIEKAAFYENLTINVNKQTGSTDAYVVKYVPNSAPFTTADNSYSFDAAIQMTQIFFNGSSENKMGNGCIRWSIWLCNNDGHGGIGPIHVAEANCTSAYVKSGESCIDAAGNGGSSGGPVSPGGGNSSGPSVPGSGPIGGQSGGGGGNSGNNPPYNPNLPSIPVITTPIPPVEVQIVDPCTKLKEKTNEYVFKNKVNQLISPNIFSKNSESGFVENGFPGRSSVYTNLTADSNTHSLHPPDSDSLKFFGFTHVHQNDYIVEGDTIKTIKMFSVDDIITLLVRCQRGADSLKRNYQDVYALMLSSEGHFALKIAQPISFAEINAINWANFNSEYVRLSTELTKKKKRNAISVQKMLLSLLKENGLEHIISLYESKNANATEWRRKTLNNNNSLNQTDCI